MTLEPISSTVPSAHPLPHSHILTFPLSHLLTLLLCLPAWAAASLPQSQPASQVLHAQWNTIRLARSEDGLTFAKAAEVPFQDAVTCDLLRLPTGRFLVLVSMDGRLAVSRSQDDGKSWSTARPIRLNGANHHPVQASAGTLVLAPDGSARLYFVPSRSSGGNEASGSRRPAELASATTRNGLDYELDRDFRFPGRLPASVRPVAVRFGSQLHLYLVSGPSPDRKSRNAVEHFTSTDGRRLQQARPVRSPGFSAISDIYSTDNMLRAYATTDDGVCSMTSTDGVDWTSERDLRLPNAADLLVAPLKEGGFLALCSAPADGATRKLPQLAEAASAESPGAAASPDAAAEAPTEAAETTEARELSDADAAWEPFTASPNEANLPFTDSPDARQTAESAADQYDYYPPKPDFVTPVDYAAWYRQQNPVDVPDNAYADFQALHEEWANPPGLKPAGWPDGVNDMFNGQYDGPIGPWDPAEHPEWEQTHQALSGFLDDFSMATWHESLVYPPNFSTASEDGPVLMSMLLPSLAENRAWVKAAVADAWRMEDGKVSPEKMLDRFGASLRAATLTGQGPTLINQLVRIAEQNLVEQSARLALQNNVFSTPEQLAAAYNLLASSDFPSPDPDHWLRSEAAMSMETVQYAFPPAGPDGQVHLDLDRAVKLAHMMGLLPETVNAIPPEYANMGGDDARRLVDALDSYNRQLGELWRTGYPQVRSSQISELGQRVGDENPLLKPLLPGLDRAYAIETRAEASRRATQLSYAVHLYKAQTGAWPASLADLPAEYGDTIRTDPFTGCQFGYQLTESGPKIYSLGEDGLDNGGVHSQRWGDDRNEGGPDSDDYVFWPPQRKK